MDPEEQVVNKEVFPEKLLTCSLLARPQNLIRKSFLILKTSGNGVYYTNTLILLIKMMLCSKLHCQKFLRLKSFSYKITWREEALGLGAHGQPRPALQRFGVWNLGFGFGV